MPSVRRNLGQAGEAAAAAHLRRAGYSIVARNWRCREGELDLVAQAADLLVFVEVKTRRGGAWSPEEAITPTKAARLVRLAYAYLTEQGLPFESAWRIDLIALEIGTHGQIVRLEQIEHAVTG